MADFKNYGQKGVADDTQLGKRGPRIIKDGTQDVRFRDKDDAAFVNVKVADPVASEDAATKAYVDANATQDPGFRAAVLDETASQNIGTALPAGALVQQVKLEITTPYSTGATIEIGDGTNVYMTVNENDAELAETFVSLVPGNVVVAGGGQITATVAGAPVAGAANVRVTYEV